MSAKHTPGPWVKCLEWVGSEAVGVEGNIVCRQPHDTALESLRFWPANRDLICAAPDMLEALKNLENDDSSIPEHAWALVRAAIARAEGRAA